MAKDTFKPDEGTEIPVAVDAEGGKFRRAEDELAGDAQSVSIKESFDAMFEGADLTEEFKEKAQTIFEAAVHAAAREIAEAEIADYVEIHEAAVAEASEQYEAQLAEAIDEALETVTESLDTYLDYVIKEWTEENTLAIESGIKVQMAESLMTGLKDLFEAHNIDISEETIDTVAALEEEVDVIRAEANEAINEAIELKEENLALRAEAAFRDVAEGLTLVQTEKFRSLAEGVVVEDIDSFTDKLETLKESFFGDKKEGRKPQLAEETFVEANEPARVISEDHNVMALASMIGSRKQR